MTRKETKLVQVGRQPSLHAGAVNPPVYRMSTVLFPDVVLYLPKFFLPESVGGLREEPAAAPDAASCPHPAATSCPPE